jgi:hypothetical protein
MAVHLEIYNKILESGSFIKKNSGWYKYHILQSTLK